MKKKGVKMKFSCNKTTLLKSLNMVLKAVSIRTPLPILKGILLEINEDKLKISASDLNITIENTIKISSEGNASMVIAGRTFIDIIKKLPGNDISFEYNESNGNLSIKSINVVFNLTTISGNEFPKTLTDNEYLNEDNSITIASEVLNDLIKKTSFSASIEESRGILTGVLVEFYNEGIRMVAIDGLRLAMSEAKINNKVNESIIIPAKNINDISKLIVENAGEVDIVKLYIFENKVILKIGMTLILVRCMEGEYIPYNQLLKQEDNIKLIVNRENILESIERAALISRERKHNRIKLNIEKNNMRVIAKSDEGEYKEDIYVDSEGENIDIDFNFKYMLDALKAADTENILMKMEGSEAGAVITSPEKEEYNRFKYLVLPLKLI